MKIIAPFLLLLSLALPMQAALMQVTGTFNGRPVAGTAPGAPFRILSGGFTAHFDDALVAPTGNFSFDNLSLTSLFLSDPVIGATTFDLTNTALDLFFVNGALRSFTVGEITSNNSTVFGTDDFSVYYENGGGLILSQMVISEQASGFYGVDFRFNDPTTGSFTVSAAPVVPDAGSAFLLTTLGCMVLLPFRRTDNMRAQGGLN